MHGAVPPGRDEDAQGMRGHHGIRATLCHPRDPQSCPPVPAGPVGSPGPWLLQLAWNKGASCGAKDARPGLRENPGGRWRRLLGNASGFGGDSLS